MSLDNDQLLRDTLQVAASRLGAALAALRDAIIEDIMPAIRRLVDAYAITTGDLPDTLLKAAAEKPKHYYLYKHGKRRVRKKWGRILKKRAAERLRKYK